MPIGSSAVVWQYSWKGGAKLRVSLIEGPLRVLVVDSSAETVERIVVALGRSGTIVVHEQVATAEALARALERASWDVVLANCVLDDRAGLWPLELVRRAEPGLPVIVIADAEEAVAEALRAGASDFVLKSRIDRLPAVVAQALGERARARVCEQSFPTKALGRRAGLELAMLNATAQRAGGHVRGNREHGQDGTLKSYLTRADQSAAPRLRSWPTVPAGTLGGTETILVVEDDELLRAAVRRILLRRGYRVLDAASGGDGLIMAEQHDGPIELLLTDVVMPLMGGQEVASQLAMARPGTRVLYMSGYTDDVIVPHEGGYNQVAFLEKPFTPNKLLARVRAMLDGG